MFFILRTDFHPEKEISGQNWDGKIIIFTDYKGPGIIHHIIKDTIHQWL